MTNTIIELIMLSDENIEFLKSKEGKRLFRRMTKDLERHTRDNLKKRLIKPPKYVKEWVYWVKKIEVEIEDYKKNEVKFEDKMVT